MNILKNVYGSESVYLCTMCDGPMNHFHIQLIPRYSFEKRGSKNFIKERKEYKEDIEKIVKNEIKYYNVFVIIYFQEVNNEKRLFVTYLGIDICCSRNYFWGKCA